MKTRVQKLATIIRLLVLILTLSNVCPIKILGQFRTDYSNYVSLKQKVVIANGSSTSVDLEKKIHIIVCVDLNDKNSRYNYVMLRDRPVGNEANFEEVYKIYSRESNSLGEVLYWTSAAQNSQVVLFKLDSNGAIPSITMSRYGQNNEVLKRVIYYLE
jgi:hypothetical protein